MNVCDNLLHQLKNEIILKLVVTHFPELKRELMNENIQIFHAEKFPASVTCHLNIIFYNINLLNSIHSDS